MCNYTPSTNYLSILFFSDTEVWPKHSSLGRKKIGENSLVCVPTVPGEITLNVTTQPVQINYLSYLATWPKHSSLGGEKTVGEINFYKVYERLTLATKLFA